MNLSSKCTWGVISALIPLLWRTPIGNITMSSIQQSGSGKQQTIKANAFMKLITFSSINAADGANQFDPSIKTWVEMEDARDLPDPLPLKEYLLNRTYAGRFARVELEEGKSGFPPSFIFSNKIELTSDDDFQWIVRSSRLSTLLFDSLLSEIHFRLKYSWHVPSEMTAAAVMTSQRRIDRDPHSHQPFPPIFNQVYDEQDRKSSCLKSVLQSIIIYFAYFILTIFQTKM